jgi:hypothetical protein
MFAKVAKAGFLAGLLLVSAAAPAEAFGRRQATSCYTSSYYPCCPCYPGHCFVYRVSEPIEKLHGPPSGVIRTVWLGEGAIVEIDAPTGTASSPTGLIQVIQTGPGEVKYEGYNTRAVPPVMPGSPIRWSIFLCPTKKGRTTVKVGFVMSDNTIVNVQLEFDIK